MTVAAIVEIIRLSLELAVLMVKDLTPEQRTAFWTRHEDRMEFWAKFAERLSGQNGA